MAGNPARNGNSEAGNSDFTRKVDDILATWQTPRVAVGEYTRDRGAKGAERLTLEGQSTAWGTPRASDGEKGGPNQSFGAGGTPLPAQAAQWATPTARDMRSESASAEFQKARWEHPRGKPLTEHVRCFSRPDPQTPTPGPTSFEARRVSRQLFRSSMSNVPATTLRRWLSKEAWRKARLNPIFVSWLMGWPPGHALCDCSETEFSLWQQHMRGALSALPTAYGPWIWQPPVERAAPVQIDLFSMQEHPND